MDSEVHSSRGSGSGGPSLPDLNIETYPFSTVFQLLESAAYFQMFAEPRERQGDADAAELRISSDLHRFECESRLDAGKIAVDQRIGQRVGTFTSDWRVTDSGWNPGRKPPGERLEPGRPQQLVFHEDRVRFTNEIGFDGYGVGATRPLTVGGQRLLLVSGVGDIGRGVGKLEGLRGTYVLDGVLTARRGFRGLVLVRLVDPERRLRGEDPIGSPQPSGVAELDSTYLVLHGQKRDASQHTEWRLGPGGQPEGILTPAEVSSGTYRLRVGGARRLQSYRRVGDPLGRLEATISADLSAPPGTHERPGPFRTRNVYTFEAPGGRRLGTIDAEVEAGQSFGLEFPAAPGQRGLRFGGVGPILGGTGIFEGVQGTVAVNSAIGLAPHALSLINVLRIVDPDGRFRVGEADRRTVRGPGGG